MHHHLPDTTASQQLTKLEIKKMASLHIIFFTFASLQLITGASSPHSHGGGDDDLLECLTEQFRHSNLATDIIHTPQNAAYASLLPAHNRRPQSFSPNTPHLILTPFHASEIQAAVHCSRKLGVQIRVRSGGHDYEGLSYTCASPFLIVDMRNFRSVTVDDEEKTAWVQVGATLGQLYYTLSRKSKKLAFPAGVCPTVGVGGHFSGGGYGMISRKHSIAVDHIIDARLVNADGEVLDRKTMGEDLFWAIRGGGAASFGIVLEYKVELVTVPEIVTVFNVTRTLEENATELVHRWQYIADTIDDNLVIRLLFSTPISPATGNRTVAAEFTSLYLGRARDVVPIVEEKFPELGLTEEDCTEMSWIETTLHMAGLWNHPLEILLNKSRHGFFMSSYFKGKSDYVSTPIPEDGLRGLWKLLLELERSNLQFSPWGGVLNGVSESETPFPHRRGNLFMIHYGVGWSSIDESEARIDWIRRLYSFMAQYATKSPRAAYFNYKDLDIGRNSEGNYTSYEEASVWGHSYFKNNFGRLVRVKTRVDPSNVFRNEQSIPPLVSVEDGRMDMVVPQLISISDCGLRS